MRALVIPDPTELQILSFRSPQNPNSSLIRPDLGFPELPNLDPS